MTPALRQQNFNTRNARSKVLRKARPLHGENEPIPMEIQERMTKPVVRFLHQIFVHLPDKRVIPVFPAFSERAVVEEMVAVIKAVIAKGKERTWSDPHIVSVQVD